MKWLIFLSELLGTLSSLFLAWGFVPPKGGMAWMTGDGTEYKRNAARLKLVARIGFLLLAISFAIKAAITFVSQP